METELAMATEIAALAWGRLSKALAIMSTTMSDPDDLLITKSVTEMMERSYAIAAKLYLEENPHG